MKPTANRNPRISDRRFGARRGAAAVCLIATAAFVAACENDAPAQTPAASRTAATRAAFEVNLSDAEWKARLTPEQYQVLRKHATEPAFRNRYNDNKEPGTYLCAGCGAELFSSEHKFDSGTGWPSFDRPAHAEAIATSVDHDIGYARTEVHCARCGGHQGHVFDDGPTDTTGLRYCINSAAMTFRPAGQAPTTRPAD